MALSAKNAMGKPKLKVLAKERCSPSDYRRIRRWEHEHILEAMQRRLERKPDAMTVRRSTVEHIFGTLKHWMGVTHFLTRTLGRLSTEMSLQVLAYNMKRVMNMLGVAGMMKATPGVRLLVVLSDSYRHGPGAVKSG
jgi:hypothetical protein